LAIYERLGDTMGEAECLTGLVRLLHDDKQLDAAEEAASRAINLIPKKGNRVPVCQSHRVLGEIYRSKGETGKAIHHFEMALEIATSINCHDHAFGINYSLAQLSILEGRFDKATVYLERAKPHTTNSTYNLGRATELQAKVWYRQHRLKEARSEALAATDIFEKLGAVDDLESCRGLLRSIEEEMNDPVALYFDGELLETSPLPTPINSPWPFGVRKASDGTVLHIYLDILGMAFGVQWFNAAFVGLGWMFTSSSQGSAY